MVSVDVLHDVDNCSVQMCRADVQCVCNAV